MYVELILQTFSDVLPFSFLFLLIICLFSNALYIVDSINKAYKYPFENITEPDLTGCLPSGGKLVKDIAASKYAYFNTMYYGYLISLGENYIDNLEGTKYPILAWFVFLIASLALQVVFLNMVIAIMGDTFDRVMDYRDRF